MHQYSVRIGQHAFLISSLFSPAGLLLLLLPLLLLPLSACILMFLASNCLCGKYSGCSRYSKKKKKKKWGARG